MNREGEAGEGGSGSGGQAAAGVALPEFWFDLLGAYDLGPVRDVVALQGGMFLRPFLLTTDKGRFVLRGTRFRSTLEAFQFQAEAMNGAAERRVGCPRVLPDQEGCYGRLHEDAVWAVYQYLEGWLYGWPAWCERMRSYPGFAEDLGAQVAALHRVLTRLRPGGDPWLSPELPPIQFRFLERAYAHWSRTLNDLHRRKGLTAARTRGVLLALQDRIETHWQWLLTVARELGIGELPRQVVHGDISPVNLVFGQEGEPCRFIDWDCVHFGHRLYDALGDVVIRPPWDHPQFHSLDLDHVSRYLTGYRREADPPVNEEELACVPAFCLTRQLEDLRQRLSVVGHLPAERDQEYAALIAIRVQMMDQIVSLPAGLEW